MNLTNIGTIKEILGRHGFSFSKGLGQNFIINPDICPKIAENGNAAPGFGVLEIGTGIGVLTAELAKRADKVAAVEIDTRLMPVLEETLAGFSNIKIFNEDVMKCDLQKIIREEFHGLRAAVCANLPYYITTPLAMRFIESSLDVRSITIMVQKEVALRFVAKPNTADYSAITLAIEMAGNAQITRNVSRNMFFPSPNVDSAVVRIDIDRTKLDGENAPLLHKLVRSSFAMRRKTLANNLSVAFQIDKQEAGKLIEEAGFSPMVRGEALSLDDYKKLTKTLETRIK